MKINVKRLFCAGLTLGACVAAACLAPIVSTAKPPPPPPPPPTGTWSYYDANGNPYGGLRDPNTGLVWGFDAIYVTANEVGDTEGAVAWQPAMDLFIWNYPCCANATGCDYEQWSNCFWGRNDTDWRVPTKDQMVAAFNNGVFSRLDTQPATGFQNTFLGNSHWSSTTRGSQQAYTVSPVNGSTFVTGKGSSCSYFPVRGPVPP